MRVVRKLIYKPLKDYSSRFVIPFSDAGQKLGKRILVGRTRSLDCCSTQPFVHPNVYPRLHLLLRREGEKLSNEPKMEHKVTGAGQSRLAIPPVTVTCPP